MNRNALVIGGLVLAGAVVGLWMYLRKGDDATASARRAPAEPTAPIVATDPPPSTPRVTPSLPGSGPEPVATGGSDSRDYVVGGIRVRDHRSGDQQKVDIPPNVHPPEARELPSELTHIVGQKVKR